MLIFLVFMLYLFLFVKMFLGEEKLHSHILSIENVDRHKGGVYICTANNGVGQPASSQVVLHVLCKYMKMTVSVVFFWSLFNFYYFLNKFA